MLPPRYTFLFGDYRIARASSGRSKYQHTFGGPHDRKGTSREDCNGILIHLLHRLDLTDPAIPVAIPGVRWLPLYYCFDFRANDLGYRLISEDELVTFFPRNPCNVSDHEEWPSDNYPLEFPKSCITITGFDYDPTDADDAYFWAGIFGIGKLSKRNQSAVRKMVAEDWGYESPMTEKEFDLALSSPFMQGKPDGPCLNPRCPNRKKRGLLQTFAMMPSEPVKGDLRRAGRRRDADLSGLPQVLHDPRQQSMRLGNRQFDPTLVFGHLVY
jgi:hypothetical protein